jgi:aldehyde:ferredoxin oxidoreductase
MARTFQFDPTPGRHVKGGLGGFVKHTAGHTFDYKGTGYADMCGVANSDATNSSGFCIFGGNAPPGSVKRQIEAATGFSYSPMEWLALGLRIYNMRHAFNLREGMRRKDFTLSQRMIESNPPDEGPIAGIKVDNELLADNFFNAMGWTMDMVPLPQVFNNLGGLEKVRMDLYPPPPPPPPPAEAKKE